MPLKKNGLSKWKQVINFRLHIDILDAMVIKTAMIVFWFGQCKNKPKKLLLSGTVWSLAFKDKLWILHRSSENLYLIRIFQVMFMLTWHCKTTNNFWTNLFIVYFLTLNLAPGFRMLPALWRKHNGRIFFLKQPYFNARYLIKCERWPSDDYKQPYRRRMFSCSSMLLIL